MQGPVTLVRALELTQLYEVGQDINNKEEPYTSTSISTRTYKMASLKSEDPIDALTKKFEKLQLNLAEQLELLSAQLEKPAYRPKPSTSSYNNIISSKSNTNQVIYFRYNKPDHVI